MGCSAECGLSLRELCLLQILLRSLQRKTNGLENRLPMTGSPWTVKVTLTAEPLSLLGLQAILMGKGGGGREHLSPAL